MSCRLVFACLAAVAATTAPAAAAAAPPRLTVLFLGDAGHHQPAARFRQLQPVFAGRGIDLAYSDKLADLNPGTLAKYDALLLFANHDAIAPDQEKALLEYVRGGKGFVPVHCASYCFRNSSAVVAMMGAQFRSHGTGVFRVAAAKVEHPVLAGFESFASWDETYLHTKHNPKNRTVLENRTDGDIVEPWTWVRDEEKGRVFYTAWGHDQRTWSHPGFQNLLERGVRWACRQDPALAGPYADRPAMTPLAAAAKPFEYTPATVPFYPAGEKWGTIREPLKQMPKPLPAAESVKHYSTPVGFELKTFVTEDKLGGGKPLCMTWDDRGRLWLGLTTDYPNELKPRGQGRDRIVVCEDVDGDGVCDTVTEFADKLSIPTSILWARGGLIVHQAPDTLFLKDTKGTGKADVRQTLFTGWGTKDTHAGPSNMRYGFDNWVYGMVGYSGFSGTVNKEKHQFGQGLYRFKLEADLTASKLEFLRSTNNNSWGVAFNENGELFGSTANGCPLVHLRVPNRYFEQVRGLAPGALPNIALDNHYEPVTEKVRQVDWHGGFTSAAGCSIYTARTYPPEYWNRAAFVSDPTGHLTATLMVQPAGTEYVARYGWNLLAGRDEWAAPIDAQVGPDGHVWVLDWYNYIVQHNPTPQGYKTGAGNAYEIELRDKTRGRIYRVVYTKAKPEPRPTLKDATPDQCVAMLGHHNMLWRLHAQRLIVERAEWDVVPKLAAAMKDPVAAIHVVAALDGLQSSRASAPPPAAGVAALEEALKHPSPAVRAAAAKALYGLPMVSDQQAAAVAGLLSDPDPAVKVAALFAVADIGDRYRGGRNLGDAIVRLLNDPAAADDAGIKAAITVAAAKHAWGVFMAAAPGKLSPLGLAVLETAIRTYNLKYPLRDDGVAVMFPRIAAADPAVRAAVIDGLAAGWPAGNKPKLDAAGEAALGKLLAAAAPRGRGKLLKLASGWGVTGLASQLGGITAGLIATAADPKQPADARVEAAKQAVEFLPDDDDAAGKLAAAAAAAEPAVAARLFDALAGSRSKAVGAAIVAKLGELPPAVRTAALRVVLARPESAKAFLDAVEAGKLRFDSLELDQKTALAGHPDAAVSGRAKKLLAMGGGLPDADRQKVIESFVGVLKKTGDPGLGKKTYVQHCAKCHKHGGEGLMIGPDLTGFAVHPKEEILIHVMDPSRSVEGNYKMYTARLLDGRVISGLLAAETKTTVELLDAENKRHPLNRDDLEDLKPSAKSLMPEGFEKQMTPDDLANLLEFLTQKGKFVPVPLEKYATVVTTKGMFYEPDGTAERLVFPDWKPKEFKGVPFYLVDPQGGRQKNAVMLHSKNGILPPTMPKTVTLPCNTAAKAVHVLGGVGGWASQGGNERTVSMTVRFHYDDGTKEDHDLRNGVHVADYIRRIDVAQSSFAFDLGGRQVRYLAITPGKRTPIKTIELVKGPDATAPVVMAVTIETP